MGANLLSRPRHEGAQPNRSVMRLGLSKTARRLAYSRLPLRHRNYVKSAVGWLADVEVTTVGAILPFPLEV